MNLDDIAIAPGQSGSTGYNTGNIRASNGGSFKQYSSFESGAADQMRLLGDYQTKHNLNTIRGIVSRWAPGNENNTQNYINYMSHQMGTDPDQQIDLNNPETMGKFAYSQALMEKGAKNVPLSQGEFINVARNRDKYLNQQPQQPQSLDDIAQAPQEAAGEAQPQSLDDIAQEPQEAAQSATAPQDQASGNWSGNAGYLQPTARALVGSAVDVANIPAEITDSFVSAGAWLGNKLGLGDGTYQPAPRVTTADVEQGLNAAPGSLTPQSTAEKVMAGAVPFLMPTGIESGAEVAATKGGKVVNSIVRNMKESAFGSLAQSSNGSPDDLATNLALNTVGGVAFEGTGSIVSKALKGKGDVLTKLSNSVNENNVLAAKGAVLEKHVETTANDLTKADLRYTNAMRKGAPEQEINELRNSYLEADEAHAAAKENLVNHNAQAKPAEIDDLTEQATAAAKNPGTIKKGIVKVASQTIKHSAAGAAATVGNAIGGHMGGYAAYMGAHKVIGDIVNKYGERYLKSLVNKNMDQLHVALQGKYSPSQIGEIYSSLRGLTRPTKAALQGNTQ